MHTYIYSTTHIYVRAKVLNSFSIAIALRWSLIFYDKNNISKVSKLLAREQLNVYIVKQQIINCPAFNFNSHFSPPPAAPFYSVIASLSIPKELQNRLLIGMSR